MTKPSEKHHTVPKGILKNFCYSNSKIFYYSKDRASEGVQSRDIEQKFFRRHYYSVKTTAGRRSDEFEREFLQVLDSRFAEFVQEVIHILDAGRIPRWDQDTGDFARQFIYYYQKRSPDFYETLEPEKLVAQVVSEAKADPRFGETEGRDDFFCKIENDLIYRQELTDFARVQAQARQSPVVVAKLNCMSLAVARAPDNSQFIVGSHPVVRLGAGSDLELGDGIVELWTPISSRYCLGLFGATRNDWTCTGFVPVRCSC